MEEPTLDQVVEALLFASSEPLAPERLKDAAGAKSAAEVKKALDRLKGLLDAQKRPYELQEVAGGWRLATRPAYADWVSRLGARRDGRLSEAALETLAIIAYKQPISRAEIEAVRGVQAGPILQTLLERDLIRVSGKSEALGHPLLYATTKEFLVAFNLPSVDALPSMQDFAPTSLHTRPAGLAPPEPASPKPSPAGPAPASGT